MSVPTFLRLDQSICVKLQKRMRKICLFDLCDFFISFYIISIFMRLCFIWESWRFSILVTCFLAQSRLIKAEAPVVFKSEAEAIRFEVFLSKMKREGFPILVTWFLARIVAQSTFGDELNFETSVLDWHSASIAQSLCINLISQPRQEDTCIYGAKMHCRSLFIKSLLC